MKIIYIGHKSIKTDNIAATGLTWQRGEVHEVADEKKAAKLLEHKTIWADATGKSDAEIAAMLLPELKAVPADPIVRVIPEGDAFMDAFVMVVPVEVLRELHNKNLTAVFMKPVDADAFAEWKLERDTRPEAADTAPVKTGPKTQARDTKAGLDSAPKKAA